MDPKKMFFFLISGLILISGSAFADIDMKEGEWEHTIEMVMEGMPFSMPPTKVNVCVTKDDLIPDEKDNANCKTIYEKVTGNTVSYKTECVDKGEKVEMEGNITYSGTSYKGQMAMKSSNGREDAMKMKLSGRYLGKKCSDKALTKEKIQKNTEEAERLIKQRDDQEAKMMAERNKYLDIVEEAKSFNPNLNDKGACALKSLKPEDITICDSAIGKLNMPRGVWEIGIKEAQYLPGVKPPADIQGSGDEKKQECVGMYNGPEGTTGDLPVFGSEAKSGIEKISFDNMTQTIKTDIKRVGNRIIWKKRHEMFDSVKRKTTAIETAGEIAYNSNTYKSFVVSKMIDEDGTPFSLQIQKITGRLTDINPRTYVTGRAYSGESFCIEDPKGRDRTGRDYTSSSGSAGGGAKDKINKLKGLIRW